MGTAATRASPQLVHFLRTIMAPSKAIIVLLVVVLMATRVASFANTEGAARKLGGGSQDGDNNGDDDNGDNGDDNSGDDYGHGGGDDYGHGGGDDYRHGGGNGGDPHA